jgi:hypothetical protein
MGGLEGPPNPPEFQPKRSPKPPNSEPYCVTDS